MKGVFVEHDERDEGLVDLLLHEILMLRKRIAVLESLLNLPAKVDLDKDGPDNNSIKLSVEEIYKEKKK